MIAGWEPDQKTIQFETGIENLIVNSIVIGYGTQITLPHDFSEEGYIFTGWYDENDIQYSDADGEMTRAWDKEAPTSTLYAKWELTQYNITYNLAGGTNSNNNPSQYNIESPTIVLEAPTRSGYRFIRRKDSSGSTVTQIPTGSHGNITLTAEWAYEYTITVTANNIVCDYMILNGTVSTVKAISGEVIQLYNSNFGGVILKSGSSYYAQGSTFTVTGSKTFELVEKNRSQLYDSATGYYEIWTYNQLNTIVRDNLSSKYRMMANITQPEGTIWAPMGTFAGVFDGNNYWINDLTITYGLSGNSQNISEKEFGLFRVNNGTIKNLGISHGSFGFYDYTAT